MTLTEIIEVACTVYGITPDQLRGRNRSRRFVLPRLIVYTLAQEFTDATLVRIGKACGGRDHSTVISGERAARKILNTPYHDEHVTFTAALSETRAALANDRPARRLRPKSEILPAAAIVAVGAGTIPPSEWDEPLPVHTVKQRKCLTCRLEFTSTGRGNHVCNGCKSTSAWRYQGIDMSAAGW